MCLTPTYKTTPQGKVSTQESQSMYFILYKFFSFYDHYDNEKDYIHIHKN